MLAMEANVSKYTNAIGSGKQAITQRQKRKGGRGMREGWEYKKLGDLCDIYQPKTLATEQLVADGKYYVYGANGIIGRYNDYNHEQSEILLTCRGATCGTINISQPYSWINGNAMVIHRKSEDLSFDFLKYLMLSLDYSLIITGAAQPQITRQKIAPIIVKFPSLSVQQSIVSELDKINELIRLKKEQLTDYEQLTKSIFYGMFGDPIVNEKGWEVKKLGEVAMIKTGPFGSMLHKEDYITGGIPLINPMHIQNFKAVPDKDFTISKEKAAELCNYQLKINDVIFARRGDIGRCAVVSDKEAGCLCGTGSLFGRFERKLSSIYTMYVVRTTSFIKELVSKAKGATMLNLNSSTMENLRFPIPPLPLQQAFAQRIELIEKQKAEIQNTIADLETLLASRMQYWFD